MAKKIALDGQVNAQQRLYDIIDKYYANDDGLKADLDSLTPEKRISAMKGFAEFRWGKKTANPEDEGKDVSTTSDLLTAVYEEMSGQ